MLFIRNIRKLADALAEVPYEILSRSGYDYVGRTPEFELGGNNANVRWVFLYFIVRQSERLLIVDRRKAIDRRSNEYFEDRTLSSAGSGSCVAECDSFHLPKLETTAFTAAGRIKDDREDPRTRIKRTGNATRFDRRGLVDYSRGLLGLSFASN